MSSKVKRWTTPGSRQKHGKCKGELPFEYRITFQANTTVLIAENNVRVNRTLGAVAADVIQFGLGRA